MIQVKSFHAQSLESALMSTKNGYIHIRKALKDYLDEQGITFTSLLSLMDEERGGLIDALRERIHLTERQIRILERGLSSRNLNLLLFVIQAFYIINPSGMYKGFIIQPSREEIMFGEKATFEGCNLVLKALQISSRSLDA